MIVFPGWSSNYLKAVLLLRLRSSTTNKTPSRKVTTRQTLFKLKIRRERKKMWKKHWRRRMSRKKMTKVRRRSLWWRSYLAASRVVSSDLRRNRNRRWWHEIEINITCKQLSTITMSSWIKYLTNWSWGSLDAKAWERMKQVVSILSKTTYF